jgi:hypothetical protein
MKSLVVQAKRLGARVIVATEISSSGNDSNKASLNAIIRSQAFGWGADNISDLGTIPLLGADGAYANTAYFVGGLHPTDTGELLINPVMSAAVNELIGSNATNYHTTTDASYTSVAGDRYLTLTGSSAQTVSLPTSIGLSLPRYIVNLGTNAATVTTVNSETLQGNTSIAAGATAAFVPVPGPSSTGGASWLRTQ